MKRGICALLLATLIVFALSACGAKKSDDDIVVSNVGTLTVTRGEFKIAFLSSYNYYKSYYPQIGEELSVETNLNSFQDAILESLVRMKVVELKAAENNITLTEEEKEEINNTVNETYSSFISYYEANAIRESAKDVEMRGTELANEALVSQGLTVDNYKDKLYEDYVFNLISEKLRSFLTDSITLSDAEAKALFEADVEEQRTSYTQSPALFEEAQNSYDGSGGIPPLFVPEGFCRVKHILVDDETLANSLYDRLMAGEDFDSLMTSYGTDPGMQREPGITMGYLLGESTAFIPEFKEAGLKLENIGDITKPVLGSYGYHIIKLVDKLESKVVTFESVKDIYITSKLETLKQTKYNEAIEAWVAETNIESDKTKIRDIVIPS